MAMKLWTYKDHFSHVSQAFNLECAHASFPYGLYEPEEGSVPLEP
jgi:hypothetical protein